MSALVPIPFYSYMLCSTTPPYISYKCFNLSVLSPLLHFPSVTFTTVTVFLSCLQCSKFLFLPMFECLYSTTLPLYISYQYFNLSLMSALLVYSYLLCSTPLYILPMTQSVLSAVLHYPSFPPSKISR